MAATVQAVQKAHAVPQEALNECRLTPFSMHHPDHNDRILCKLLSRQTSSQPSSLSPVSSLSSLSSLPPPPHFSHSTTTAAAATPTIKTTTTTTNTTAAAAAAAATTTSTTRATTSITTTTSAGFGAGAGATSPYIRPPKRARISYDTMEVNAPRDVNSRICINNLASEIWVLIFEYVREQSLNDIISVRLACRWFDYLATPIEYQTLVLKKRLLYHRSPDRIARAYANICQYTNHVYGSIDDIESCRDNHQAVARITNNILNLKTFTWRYARTRSPSACTCPIAQMFLREPGGEGKLRQGTLVFLENVAPRHLERHRLEYLAAIPTELLVSLKMAIPCPPLMTGIQGLKEVLLRSRSLATFHYQDKGQGTNFSFSPGERLPAFVELKLQGYDWCHPPHEAARHWDFSRIRSLELLDMPVLSAMQSIGTENLYWLHTLAARDSGYPTTRERLSKYLSVVLRTSIRALKKIELTVDMRHFDPSCILAHAETLEWLSLRDFVGFTDESRRCPTLWLEHLMAMAKSLTKLRTLELDMDTRMTDPAEFLRTLAHFPKLDTLTIHVQTVVHPWEELRAGDDRDATAAMKLFTKLLKEKATSGQLDAVSWRQVTLNVGGWQPVMVRRLSRSWKSKNERGIFAERCFVMERQCLLPMEPYVVNEMPTEDLGRLRDDDAPPEPIRAYLHGVGDQAAAMETDPQHQPVSVINHYFTDVILEYMSGGNRPPGPIFAHQTS